MAVKKIAFKATAFIIGISFIIFIFLFFYLNTKVTTKKVIFIPKGSINNIVTHLYKDGYDINKFDSLILRIIGSPQQGWIDINKQSFTKYEFLNAITKAKAATKEITIIPGNTTYVALNNICKIFTLNYEKLQKAYNKLSPLPDGIIVADTYRLPLNFNEEDIIAYILNHSMAFHEKMSKKYLNSFNKKEWFRIITIASIIEKEAANIKEMPLVASVIYNRLKKGMRLQMDGTLNYGKYSNIKITSKRIKKDSSKFNTYKNYGIPPYPVSTVSKEAIDATLNPAKSDYLYFVKNKTGTHTFSKNYSSHLRAIKKQ